MWSSRLLFIAFLVLCAALCDSSAQIVAFGASNVSGFKVEPSQTWPALLEMLLQAKGYNAGQADVHPRTPVPSRSRDQRGTFWRYDGSYAPTG